MTDVHDDAARPGERCEHGVPPPGVPVEGPVYLVCAHGRRSKCCARFSGPLARALAGQYPGRVWETTHLGGHKVQVAEYAELTRTGTVPLDGC